jgi:hypothetical protein
MQSKAKTLADFRAAHDRNVIIPNKIKAALAVIAKAGPENWEYESDFLKLAGISQTDISIFRDQFADYVVETARTPGRNNTRRVWFGNKKYAAEVRNG